MKKFLLGFLCVIIAGFVALTLGFYFGGKISNEGGIDKKNNTESQETTKKEGYEINVSNKDITVNVGEEESFEITFTNPDESSIREYIKCKDQDNVIIVKYSDLEDKKITVTVEGLKAGDTEVEVSDYNYPDMKEIVKVNVVE